MARRPEIHGIALAGADGAALRDARALRWLQGTPYWAISALVHTLLVLVAMNVIWRHEQKRGAERSFHQIDVVRRVPPRLAYQPEGPRDIEDRMGLPRPKQPDNTEVRFRPTETPISDRPQGEARSNRTDMSLVPLSLGATDVLGIGRNAAAERGDPDGIGRGGPGLGPRAAISAIREALEWLRRHQHPDGYWSSRDFTRSCADPGRPCTLGDADPPLANGRGAEGFDVGVTALAMLAYLGWSHTHQDGDVLEYRAVLDKAYKWLLSQQVRSDDPSTNGRFGPTTAEEWMYNHAIATMAMGELLFLSRDTIHLSRSVEDATDWCLRAQNPGYGWKYGYRGGKSDTSVTGWMVLALKTSKACADRRLIRTERERLAAGFGGALAWFDRATSKSTGITGYESPGDEGSRLLRVFPDPYPYSKSLSAMTAVAVLCRIFAGESRRSESIRRGVGILLDEPPEWKPARGKTGLSRINMYYWYYGSYALFQVGGEPWRRWNEAMLSALLPTQRLHGCEGGSWDPIDEWGPAGGRVYSTAINAMTLEVYYRFRRQEGG